MTGCELNLGHQLSKTNLMMTTETTHSPSSEGDVEPEDGFAVTTGTLGAVVLGNVGGNVGVATGGGVAVVGK